MYYLFLFAPRMKRGYTLFHAMHPAWRVAQRIALMLRIDWLSFTLDIGSEEGRAVYTLPNLISEALSKLDADLPEWLGLYTAHVPHGGRAPYTHSWTFLDGGVSIFASPVVPHALVEISGKGLTALYGKDIASEVLSLVAPRLSRIDIAHDIETETRPIEFCSQRSGKKFSSRSEVVSQSGETVYIGSKKSDRYARVYRYNPPHPRAHLLRIEYCIKGMQSRVTAQNVLEHGIEAVNAALKDQFGWQHPVIILTGNAEIDLVSWRPERREGKTVSWLYGTVARSVVKLHRAGIIDAREWFQKSIWDEIDSFNKGRYDGVDEHGD